MIGYNSRRRGEYALREGYQGVLFDEGHKIKRAQQAIGRGLRKPGAVVVDHKNNAAKEAK